MFRNTWGRLVLDEAHTIRNPNTQCTKAMYQLKVAGPRWMLTGTPVQNTTMDIFPLVRVIGVPPFDNPDHGSGWFKSRIVMPLKRGQTEGIVNLRTLIGQFTLRRVKGLLVSQVTHSVVGVGMA